MKGKIIKTTIEDAFLLEVEYFQDERGFFFEVYHEKAFQDLGLPTRFVQDNHSRSVRKVLRGIHYQDMSAPMGKLIRCAVGEIFDVVVDLRVGSPSFGKWIGERLSDQNKRQLYCPVGFGHGFVTLSDFADVQYKCTGFYTPGSEGVIRWNDPDINVDWPVKDPTLSPRDANAMTLKEYLQNPPFKYSPANDL